MTLDAIRTGFVERLAGRDISRDFVITHRQKCDVRGLDARFAVPRLPVDDGETRVHGVGAPRETSEHRASFSDVMRFAEHLALDDDRRVGGDEHAWSVLRRCSCFADRMRLHELSRIAMFAGVRALVVRSGDGDDVEAERFEQEAPPR